MSYSQIGAEVLIILHTQRCKLRGYTDLFQNGCLENFIFVAQFAITRLNVRSYDVHVGALPMWLGHWAKIAPSMERTDYLLLWGK